MLRSAAPPAAEEGGEGEQGEEGGLRFGGEEQGETHGEGFRCIDT